MRKLLSGCAVLAMVVLAGCGGGSAANAKNAAQCLRDVLDNRAATSSCQHGRVLDATPAGTSLAPTTNAAGSVACILKTGNEYICQATGDGDTYDVTYDGKHIAYGTQ